MDCEKLWERFEEFHSKTLPPAQHDAIAAHAAECPDCAHILREFGVIKQGLQTAAFDIRLPENTMLELRKAVIRKALESRRAEAGSEPAFVKKGYTGKLSGHTLENYELFEEIGKGGMGTVYRARQISMDRIVALKVLKEVHALDDKFIDRFLKEARAAGRLNHLNMITVHHVGITDGKYFFAMEYVDGETVQEMLDRHAVIKPIEAVRIAVQVANALKYAHANHIIHRDVKPDNIMIDRMNIAKLADLGIATTMHEQAEAADGPKKAVGTPNYMSPEQARGEELDFRSDIYSLGASLFHMVTGEPPFKGANPVETMKLRLSAEVPSARERNPDVPAGIDRVIMQMMAKDPKDRFADYDSLIAALDKAAKGMETTVRHRSLSLSDGRPVPQAHPLKKLVYAVIGAAAGLALLLGGLKFMNRVIPADNPDAAQQTQGGAPVYEADITPPASAEETPAVRSEEEDLLETMLAEIEASLDHELNLARLTEFRERYPEIAADTVAEHIKQQEFLKRKTQVAALVDRAAEAVKPQSKGDDFGACLALLDAEFAGLFAGLEAEKEFQALREGIQAQARTRFLAVRERADKLLADGSYNMAKSEIEQALRFNLQSIKEAVADYKAQVDEAEQKALMVQRAGEQERITALKGTFLAEIGQYEAKRQFQDAFERCNALERNPDYHLIDTVIRTKKSDLEALIRLEAMAREALVSLKGQKRRLQLTDGTWFQEALILGVSGNMINLEALGGAGAEGRLEFGLAFDRLAFEEVMRLARTTAQQRRKPDLFVSLFHGDLVLGDADTAAKDLGAASGLGLKDTARYETVLSEARVGGKELRAQAQLEEIQSLVATRKFTGLSSRITRMKEEFGDTECYRRNEAVIQDAIDRMTYYSQAGKLGYYFKGRVKTGNDQTLAVQYDFTKPDQLDDWRATLGTWEAGEKGLAAGFSPDAGKYSWMYRNGLIYNVRFSGEMRIEATVRLDAIYSSWNTAGVFLGPYRLELPHFIQPSQNPGKMAGISKLLEAREGKTCKNKIIDVAIEPRKDYRIALATVMEGETPNLVIEINDYKTKVQLSDGLPHGADLGLYVSMDKGVVFSNVVVSGSLDNDSLTALYARETRQKDLAARLDAGQTVDIFNGKDLEGWFNPVGLWYARDGMIRGESRGALLFDQALEQYEIEATVLENPAARKQNYRNRVHLTCGADQEGMFRAGFFQVDASGDSEAFIGWELGEGFDMRKRLHQTKVEANQDLKERDKEIKLTLRYTNEAITLLLDGQEVFSCPNPKSGRKTRAGLFIEWGEIWYKDIKLRKI